VTPPDGTDKEVADLIQRAREAATAIIRGDSRKYFRLLPHADDYVLMAPWGGEPRRGVDTSEEALEALAAFFQGGEAELEVVQSYASSQIVVLAVIERQHGKVGGLAEQDLSLRVTLVFRRDDSEWRLVHRHADPLVQPIGEAQLGALLRGDHQP
jgi:ketosteroid isomerase-like protein